MDKEVASHALSIFPIRAADGSLLQRDFADVYGLFGPGAMETNLEPAAAERLRPGRSALRRATGHDSDAAGHDSHAVDHSARSGPGAVVGPGVWQPGRR